jgi:hypothetical protein
MLRRVALVRADVSEERSACTIRVTRIGGVGTLAHFVFLRSVRWLLVAANVPSSPILVTLMMEAPKRRFLQKPHGVTSQKTPFFEVFAIFTSRF